MRSSIIEELKSVKSITLLFDEWTNTYCKIPFMGTRIATVNSEWDMKIYTLHCSPLIGHTAENIKNHIKGVIAEFFLDRLEPLKLHFVHDGASKMMKASRLLKVEEPQHCLAHSLHLLLSEDGFKKVQGVQGILTKARNFIYLL